MSIKYFIDFEATQFSEEIISVGCFREDGETFYSLIAPTKGKITPFITNLTGITEEAASKAMNADYVFELFYTWAFAKTDDLPTFFCWGDSDAIFLKNTFKHMKSIIGKFVVGYICTSLQDYGKIFSKKCGCKDRAFALIKVMNKFDPAAIQTHNSLDDATMLYQIYDNVHHMPPAVLKELMGIKEEEKEDNNRTKWTEAGLEKGTICIVNKKKELLFSFANYQEAANWIIETKMTNQPDIKVFPANVAKKIKKAISRGESYYSMIWRQV